MNKQKFNQIVLDQSRLGEKELIELAELSSDYPYSQVIHTLVAKGSHDLKLQNATSKLHKAAFYVTDRGVLKQVITGGEGKTATKKTTKKATEPKAPKQVVPQSKTTTAKSTVTAKKSGVVKSVEKPKTTPVSKPKAQEPKQELKVAKPFDTIESYSIKPADKSKVVEVSTQEKPLSEQVLESIAALKRAREQAQVDFTPVKPKPKPASKATTSKKTAAKKAPAATEKKAGSTTKAAKTTASTKAATGTKTSASKKAAGTSKTTAKAKAAATKKSTSAKPKSPAKKEVTSKDAGSGVTVEKKTATKATSKSTSKAKSKSTPAKSKTGTAKKKTSDEGKVPTKQYLKKIKKSKPKESAVGTRQKEQIEIINKFIKEGGIKKPEKPSDESSTEKDLSSESVEFHENLVSENLAKIFTSQKQYNKAIDIYKKLIWKFPQKKSYFAAQIEELKKL